MVMMYNRINMLGGSGGTYRPIKPKTALQDAAYIWIIKITEAMIADKPEEKDLVQLECFQEEWVMGGMGGMGM